MRGEWMACGAPDCGKCVTVSSVQSAGYHPCGDYLQGQVMQDWASLCREWEGRQPHSLIKKLFFIDLTGLLKRSALLLRKPPPDGHRRLRVPL